MFYYVEGTVALLKQGLAVIDCGGVGYACHASQNTIGKLKIGAHVADEIGRFLTGGTLVSEITQAMLATIA